MDELTRLYKIRKTCMEMLHDRGYLIPKEELEKSKDKFREDFGENPRKEDLMILVPRQDDPTEQILVYFAEQQKIGVPVIKDIHGLMQKESVGRAILVYSGNITSPAKLAMEGLLPRYRIEQFTENELLVNITQHVLVPQHRVLTDEEKKTLLQRYKIKETQLPRIQHSDPVARYFGLQRGQVVRIVRPSETAGRYVTYRFCV